ncbi:tyrosine-type recombinase/integrase [Enterococcus timonensis]|uniref:tyrosine-type recombinase/integrase n=1 Tax=Enterococcus timonensis TaxID=1852364 RepID=UPI0008DAA1AE|nr:site-specific integrase [Enterococcus timonensis]
MWVEERTDKKGKTTYKYIERFENPETKKLIKKSITLEKNNRQVWNFAQKELNRMIAEETDKVKAKSQENGIIPNDKTLGDMIDEWFLEINDPRSIRPVKGSTLSGYSYGIDALKNKLMILEINMRVQDVTFDDVQAFYDRMTFDIGYQKSYVKRFRAIIRGAFTLAYKKRYVRNLDQIHFSRIKEPLKTIQDMEKRQIPRYFEKDEVKKIFEICNSYNPLYTQVFELQYLTGMRFGEVMALEEKNFREGFLLDIHGTFDNAVRSKTRRKKVPPKTKKSFRTIELGDKAVEIIKSRIYHNQFIKDKKTNFLFVTRHGKPYDLGTLNGFLNAHQQEFGITTKASTHVFRHTHISLLAEKKVPLQVIMERVGHEDRETTEKIYMHVTKKQKTDLLKTLNSF